MKYLLFLFPIFLQAQCLIPTHSYRLICADEVRYADSISSGSRLYISSRNAFVTSPRSVFSLVNGYGQHFIQITNSANSQKVAINRAWINRIDSTSSNKALIYIKDISVTFTTTESYTAVKDSAIACFIRSVASGLATLSDGDYGDVVVSGGGLVMTVDKPDLGLHNLADGDFSVVADSTALSLTNTRQITLQTKNIDGWISRYLQTHNSLTLRTNNTTKTSRIFVDTTGANFQFVNGANNASLRIGDSVAVRFNTSGSVGQVLTVTSVDGDGRLVINPKTGGSGTANCEQTLTKNSHGFSKWTPIYWNGSAWARPTFDSIIPTYIVVDSTSVNTFKVSNCGNYSSELTAGLYYYKGASPGYSLTPTSIPTPLFEVAQARLILQPLVGFNLAGGSGGAGITDGDKGEITVTDDGATWTIDNGVISNAKLATNAVDSTKAANLSPNDLAQTGAATNDVLTWTGSKYAPRPASGGGSGTVTGTGTSGQGAYWDGVSSIAGGTGFLYDGSGTITLGTALTTPILRGSTSANGDLVIDGTSSATKTSSYVDIQQGGGYAGINTGSSANNLAIPLHIGASTYSPSSDPVILINRPISNATGSGNAHAFSDASGITRTGSIGYNSFDALPLFSGASFDHYVAFQGRADFNNSGNTTGNCYGLWTKTNNIAGTITNNFGAYAANPTNTGTIATNYGFYTESQTAGTTNYGFYANGTMPNYFGGNLALGGAPITNNKLSVVATNADFATYISNSAAAGSSYGLVVDAGGNASDISLRVRSRASVDYLYVRGDGNVGIGTASPTARVHLRTGTATANTAPLKFTSGTNLTTAEAGAIEYDGTEFYATNSTASRTTLARVLKGSNTLDFGSTAAGAVTDLTITVTGAADGDVVSLSVPNASQTTTGAFSAWVSASNTVTVRYRIAALIGSEDPASGVFKVTVTK